MSDRHIVTELAVSQEVIDLLNELIRFEDRPDHREALAAVVEQLGGTAASCAGEHADMVARYERALEHDLPPLALDAIRRNLLARRRA